MHNQPHSDATKDKISAAKRGVPNIKKRKIPRFVGGAEMWQCSTCKEWKPREAFYPKKRNWNGIGTQCRKCHTACNLRTRNKDTTRENNKNHMRRAKAANPEKFRERDRAASRLRPKTDRTRARQILNAAVRVGTILKPQFCSSCGSQAKLSAHHGDYSQPLAVEWLCYECHGKKHRLY